MHPRADDGRAKQPPHAALSVHQRAPPGLLPTRSVPHLYPRPLPRLRSHVGNQSKDGVECSKETWRTIPRWTTHDLAGRAGELHVEVIIYAGGLNNDSQLASHQRYPLSDWTVVPGPWLVESRKKPWPSPPSGRRRYSLPEFRDTAAVVPWPSMHWWQGQADALEHSAASPWQGMVTRLPMITEGRSCWASEEMRGLVIGQPDALGQGALSSTRLPEGKLEGLQCLGSMRS